MIGKNGIKRLKKEGDFCTPMGRFSLGPIYYRKDRINKLNTKLNIYPITKNMIGKIIQIIKTITS